MFLFKAVVCSIKERSEGWSMFHLQQDICANISNDMRVSYCYAFFSHMNMNTNHLFQLPTTTVDAKSINIVVRGVSLLIGLATSLRAGI